MKNKIFEFITNLSGRSKLFLLILFDLITIFLTFSFSYFLYLNTLFEINLTNFTFLFFFSLLAIPIFNYFGLYKSLIKYIEYESVWDILKAVTVYLLTISFIVYFLNDIEFSRRVLLINYSIILLIIIYSRYFAKNFIYSFLDERRAFNSEKKINLIIFGADNFGIEIYNNIKKNITFNLLGFIDLPTRNAGRYINKYYIYNLNKISEELNNINVDQIIIPENTESNIIEKIYEFGSKKRSKIFLYPSIDTIMNNNFQINQLKELKIENILSRKIISPMKELIDKNISNKVVLVTGAGGSIGSEISSIIINNKPLQLILLDKNEYNLYKVYNYIKSKIVGEIILTPILTSVEDYQDLELVFKNNTIDVCFHAAAYKHVDLVQSNFLYSLKNNVLGTLNTIRLSIKFNIKNYVLISTDKAVRPTNYMGASKRFSELILIYYSKYINESIDTNLSAVRFGNVIGSSGSVIPLFNKQINAGGPVTVTDKNVKRYFMTINEAAELVIQSSSISESGDIFVLDMGEQVLINEIAKKMINLKGLKLVTNKKFDNEIEIIYTGLRPGEKLNEELYIDGNFSKTVHPKIYKANENNKLVDNKFGKIIQDMELGLKNNNYDKVNKILINCIENFKI